jgi:sodium/bile acid cotransporter 7
MVEQELGKETAPASNSVVNRHPNARNSTSSDGSTSTPSPEIKTNPQKQNWPLNILKFVAGQWFLISLGLVIVVASQVQVPIEHQRLKSTVVSYLCVSVIFFLTGCTLSTKILIDNFARWQLHLFVQAQIYLVTSSVIFGVVSLCAINKSFMDPGLLLGLILTGCTPTTIASNVIMTGQAHGNQALTVVESTLSNFLGPFLTPILFKMYISGNPWYADVLPESQGGYGEIYRRVFKQLGLSLFVPMVCNSTGTSEGWC